jgi:hypothetical protein
MPDDPPALEAANEVAGHRYQKLFHAEMAGGWKNPFSSVTK